MPDSTYDAVVVGSGPNGLAAAIAMQQAGLSVLLIEGKNELGGGLRTAELTLPGFRHDICSAIHPLAVASPYFQTLPLAQYGLEYLTPPVAAAHPFDDGTAAAVLASIDATAATLGPDAAAYRRLLAPLVAEWPSLVRAALGPLRLPPKTLALARFGLSALLPATVLARRFSGEKAKGLLAGMAAHSIQPLSNLTTSAIGLVLLTAAHRGGWPLARGGSQSIADALVAHFRALGGHVETGTFVRSLGQLPAARAVLLDVTPAQLLEIAGHSLSRIYQWQLRRYRYGMGVFKVDWALAAPIPFTAPECAQAGTVHLGGTLAEIAAGEQAAARGQHPARPFVLLAQQSLFDATRAPAGQHTAWAYCHVPNGSRHDMTAAIESQVERFAPGFRERILARHTFDPLQMQAHNPNYVGGDINGGVLDIGQLFTRPALRASNYRTSQRGLYLCSSATPPGGGVHGMCGYRAARLALREVFGLEAPPLQGEG
ncbi:phytoene desaturase family protein [Hymenobacter properus]|uniref:NAD(P)/FAD-dependent oxidoreductase n=1 Tax=Hymenobacter properus TaxID=2791026 RepID=A0A931FKI3_9BACT|nr:NAD(P)/FAD-dependent oxidoreductase [Hymenobacter properus]MBF9141031.1 NAD(P)/FAD-dependent oxidoreductase [Hymenobacter properus]MBR7719840.1 NAD(P)/FAD-dependent oxidoreductase [Microvirga sp. SRT04]